MEDFIEEENALDESLEMIFSEYEKKKKSSLGYFTSLKDYQLTKIDMRSIYGGELEAVSPAEFSNI